MRYIQYFYINKNCASSCDYRFQKFLADNYYVFIHLFLLFFGGILMIIILYLYMKFLIELGLDTLFYLECKFIA